jgi:hypothetical protein
MTASLWLEAEEVRNILHLVEEVVTHPGTRVLP